MSSVRQQSEWDAGHLPGAVHVELGSLTDPLDVDRPMTVMCGHGERAMTGASVLERLGHREISVLTGGPTDWARDTGAELVTGS